MNGPLADAAPGGVPGGIGERWLAWRDRLLASGSFRRRAAALWLTRPFARRRARALFDVMAGFVYSQVLLACVRLQLFDRLAAGPMTVEAIAERTALPVDAAQRLLAAAASLGLTQRRRGARYGLGPLGATMVGNRAIEAMVEHHAVLYGDLADPVALLRSGGNDAALARCFAYATSERPGELSEQRVRGYSAVMAASQPLVADEVLDAYPIARHRCLLDVGGGEAVFLAAAAARAPSLRLMLFDLPAVADAARARIDRLGFGGRATVYGGDFYRDALPRGADLVTLVRIIHDHDDAGAMRILRAVHDALEPGGTLLLAEQMADTPGALPMGDAYFGFYLLAMGRGRPRSAATLQAMLAAAGFREARLLRNRVPLQVQLIAARH